MGKGDEFRPWISAWNCAILAFAQLLYFRHDLGDKRGTKENVTLKNSSTEAV